MLCAKPIYISKGSYVVDSSMIWPDLQMLSIEFNSDKGEVLHFGKANQDGT